MAEYEMRVNTGSLFKNKKPKSGKSPPIQGRINIEGKLYWLNGFHNVAKSSGEPYIGLTASPIDDQGSTASAPLNSGSDDGWGL